MSVQVNQTRQRDQPIGIKPVYLTAGVRRVHKPTVADQQIRPPAAVQIGTANEQLHHSEPPSSSYSTLIRTDTPAATWPKINELAASAASAEISKPRFIGPG